MYSTSTSRSECSSKSQYTLPGTNRVLAYYCLQSTPVQYTEYLRLERENPIKCHSCDVVVRHAIRRLEFASICKSLLQGESQRNVFFSFRQRIGVAGRPSVHSNLKLKTSAGGYFNAPKVIRASPPLEGPAIPGATWKKAKTRDTLEVKIVSILSRGDAT